MPRKLVERKHSSASSKSAVASFIPKNKKAPLKKKIASKKESARKVVKMVTKAEKAEHISITNGTKKTVLSERTISKPITVKQAPVQGALFSPLLLRINNPQAASNVARYTGVMFVVIGAIFTIYNINAVNSYFNGDVRHQEALVASATDCIPGTIGCNTISGSGGGDTFVNPTIDPTPDPDFNIESSSNDLIGTVMINITVPLASQIVLIAVSTADSIQTYTLGNLSRVSDLAWRTHWRTSEYLDGTYRLKAVITNQYGTYNFENPLEYTLLNHPIETTQNSTTIDTTTATTSLSGSLTIPTTTLSEPLSTIAMRIEVDPVLRGRESVRTFVEGASSVKFFIRPRGTTASTFTTLGSAGFSGNAEWRFEWDTVKIPNGTYDLRAQALLQTGSSVTKTIGVGIDNATITDTDVDDTYATSTDLQEIPPAVLEPTIKLNIAGQSPLAGGVEIYIDVPKASYVELYSIQDKSLTPRFIGLARKQSDTVWRYRLETINIPNGSYQLFAKVRHVYGDSVSGKVFFSIKNIITEEQTPEEATYVESLKEVSLETQIITNKELLPPPELFESPTIQDENVENSAPIFEDTTDEVRVEIEDLLSEFNEKAQALTQEYARAIRTNNTDRKEEVRAEMNALEEEVLTKLPNSDAREDITRRIKEYINSMHTELRERVERTETIIKERVGDAITKDTDKDGLSDYDEVSIYQTDPFIADTDKDGYTDGAEILSGYNPVDSAPQVNIQYESPKDKGLVREDLFTVTTVSALSSETEISSEEAEIPNAVITGTGLPNSFVTLYIFSTPIIVTVKTDTQGNWSYIFDKELEDGDHEVYVGITDNAGKIVAKSNPFAFVKTAEAFSPVDAGSAAVFVTEPETPALISEQMMLAIGSIAVVAIGLVLILLGLHAKPREEILEPA